jgi:hypothetical protein
MSYNSDRQIKGCGVVQKVSKVIELSWLAGQRSHATFDFGFTSERHRFCRHALVFRRSASCSLVEPQTFCIERERP